MSKKIIVTYGPSLSGKTTWARQYVSTTPNTYLVSRDDERLSLFGEHRPGSKEEESLINSIVVFKIQNLLAKNATVVLDGTFLHKKDFGQLVYNFPNVEIEFKRFDLGEDFTEIAKRNTKRFRETGKLIPTNSLRRQIRKLEEINYENRPANEKFIHPQVLKISYNRKLELWHPETTSRCIIVDIDGTLAWMNGRNPYAGHEAATDKVNPAVAKIVQLYHESSKSDKIFFFSGRSKAEGAEEVTRKWIVDNVLPEGSFELHMREAFDFTPDYKIKRKMFKDFIEGQYYVDFVLDDRPAVIRTWERLGLNVLSADPLRGEF